MNVRHVASCGLVCAVLALTGCDKGRQDPPEVTVRIVNVAPGFADLGFQREQSPREQETPIAFKGAIEATYDVDAYDFFVFERTLTNTAGRTFTFNRELKPDRRYTFVLSEVAGAVVPIVVETELAPATEAQIFGVHAGEGLPAMDLYLERPGVGIAGATPRGTFGAQQQIAARTVASGEYELWLTAAGNPANVLFSTSTITLPAGVTSGFVVVAESDPAAPQISVALVQPTTTILNDRNARGSLRVINGATDMAPRDFAVHSQFSPPLFTAIPFADPTAYAPIAIAAVPINVTPVGNPGVLELSSEFIPAALLRSTLLFTGPAGTLAHALLTDDGRRIHNEAKIGFLNAATQFTNIDVVMLPVGDSRDPTVAVPTAALAVPGSSLSYGNVPPGDYNLYLRQTGTTTMLAGPTPVTLAGRGIYGVLAVNGPDTATAELRFFDDFP